MIKLPNKNKKNKSLIFNKIYKNFSFLEFNKKNIQKVVEKLIQNEINIKKLCNPESLKENKILTLKKFDYNNIRINFKNNENFIKSIDIKNFFIKNNKIKDKYLKDALNDHFSLQIKLKLNNSEKLYEKDLEMYSVLTSKDSYETNFQNNTIIWNSENLTNNNLIPREYKLWLKRNFDNLEQLRTYNYEEYKLKIFEKLNEIYKNSNNNLYLQKISGNTIVDLDNNISSNELKEYEELAIEFYINEYKDILKGNCQTRIDLLNNILWSELENLPEKFCIKFIEHGEVISYIVNISTKGTIFLN